MLSVVVCFFNNQREARNTLFSLTREYQTQGDDIDYEVIAIDHGSSNPLSPEEVLSYGPQFRYQYVENAPISPVAAINEACRNASGEHLMVIIDGAHILSPGILRLTVDAFKLFPSPLVATVPFHLGPEIQNVSITKGYSPVVEDNLLAESRWRDDGYRLFDIAGAFSDTSGGWFGCLFESGCFAIRKEDYIKLGGFNEGFVSRGGGLANLDFLAAALARDKSQYVLLLGEGTFHQVHGGVASNAPAQQHPWNEFHREYESVRGKPYKRVFRKPYYLGTLQPRALRVFRVSSEIGDRIWGSVT